jgi:hypothetical protein
MCAKLGFGEASRFLQLFREVTYIAGFEKALSAVVFCAAAFLDVRSRDTFNGTTKQFGCVQCE